MPEPRANIMIQVPIPLKVMVEQYCEANKLPVSGWVRKLIADAVEYKLPPTAIGRARKYATIEERVAAQKSRDKRRKAIVKMLLEKYASGEISLDEIVDNMESDEAV